MDLQLPELGSAEASAAGGEDDDLILLSPPQKRNKVGDPEESDKEPLCCSTPQHPRITAEEDENRDEDLDATLEILGISRDSIDVFIDEVESPYADGAIETVRTADSTVEAKNGRGMEVNYVPEIMEEIFVQLPIFHLYGSCRLVCRQWNNIICREKFLYWKKRYYMYKSGHCVQSTQRVTGISQKIWGESTCSLETNTIPLVMFLSEQFKRVDISSMAEKSLLSHPQSCCVMRIRELYPIINSKQVSYLVSTVVLLVLCSRGVHEVQTVIISLLASSLLTTCKRVDVMEIFYCLATLLLVGWREHDLPMSESSNTFLTAEQMQVVKYKMQPGEVVKVMAFAGTGKTTTLLRFTVLNPHMQFLYCVYNKSVQEHASTLFPCNVKCQTFHSLAHGSRGDPLAVGWKYFSKRGTLSSYTVSQCVNYKMTNRGGLHFFSNQVFRTLERFIASGGHQLMDGHIPTIVMMRRNARIKINEYEDKMRLLNDPRFRDNILREADTVWQRMTDISDKDVRMTDDGYLKLFQLSQPQIRGYDCILVDEAQDLTPAIISLITSQRCAKIFVGDSHQQIYGFRGAKNALEQITADRIFHLTESFRFGPEIAYVAACTLSTLKDVWRKTLIGSMHPGRIDGISDGQVAIISRMNATLFEEMVKTVRSRRNLKLGFAGGIQKYEFDMYLDIHKLLNGKKKEITHRFIKRWPTFNALSSFADKTDDVALINKIKICQKYPDLPVLIEKIRSTHSRDITHADIVFSTTHKSKGLEFDTVKLTDDYSVYHDEPTHDSDDDDFYVRSESSSHLRNPDIEERNLLYVGVTRAKKSLILTQTLARVLKETKEYFVYPTSEESLGMCSVCNMSRPYPSLHLQSLPLTVTGNPHSNATPFMPGMVCRSCACITLPFLNSDPLPA